MTKPCYDPFTDQKLISHPEACSFTNVDIDQLRQKGVFPPSTIFKSYDPSFHADFISPKWVCFPEFPFTLGLRYPFPPLFNDFFSITGLCYAQTMPMIWRTLFVIQTAIDFHDLDFSVSELAHTYNLRSHGSSYFLFQIKPNRRHLVLRATQNDPKWKGKFFFVERNSLPNGDQIPSSWILKANFAELAPPNQDTEGKVRRLLKIPESERTFKHPQQSESSGSRDSDLEAIMSAHFSLSDIDADTPIVKREKPATESSKSRLPNLRSKSAAKRKRSIDLEEESSFEKVHAQLLKCHNEKIEAFEDMQRLAQVRMVAAEKDAAEIAKLKKEVKDLKAGISKVNADADARILREKEVLLTEIKKDAAIAILEARILMATNAAAKGFDTSIWSVQIWKERLAKLKGEDPEIEVIPGGESGKAPKSPAPAASKATTEGEKEEVTTVGLDIMVV